MEDPFRLGRFVDAQDAGGAYGHAVDELRAGRKTTHWMWFVFPQVAGLGRSATSARFAISSLDEARAYLGHPVLGPRILECTRLVVTSRAADAAAIFGPVDAQKLQSSVTLFARADPGQPLFGQVLDRYFDGIADAQTDRRL